MKRLRWVGISMAAVGVIAGVGLLTGAKADRFETVVVGRGDIESTVSAIGTLKPRTQVEVGARVSGQIERLHVKAGDVVKKGQLLAEIDSRIPLAAVRAGRAELANLKAKLAEQSAQLRLSEQQLTRQRQLLEIGATRHEDVQIAEANYATTAARIDQLRAQAEQTQSTLSGDEVLLDYTRIYAPIAGTVISVSAEEGQTLNATYQTPAIMHIADLSVMTVWTDVSEADIRKVRTDMPVYFTTLGGAGRRWTGQVRQVLPAPPIPTGQSANTALAPSTRKVILYTALFDVDNQDGALMPQMTAQVSFVAASASAVTLAPLPALVAAQEQPDLYRARVINKDGKLESRDVRIGVRTRLSAEVLAGLQPGDRLVVKELVADSGPGRLRW